MIVTDAGSRNAGSDIGTALPYRDVWRPALAECDAADAVFAEIDAHAFAQADAFSNPESHALPFDSISPASHYMAFRGLGPLFQYASTSIFFFSCAKAATSLFRHLQSVFPCHLAALLCL